MNNNEKIEFLYEKMYEVRKSKGISQEELSEKIGVSRQAISKWESGERMPDIKNLITLCNVLDLKLSDLVTGVDELISQSSNQKSDKKSQNSVKRILLTILILIVMIYIMTVLFKLVIINIFAFRAGKYKDVEEYSYQEVIWFTYDNYITEEGRAKGEKELNHFVRYKDNIQQVTEDYYNDSSSILSDIWIYWDGENKETYGIEYERDFSTNIYKDKYGYTLGFGAMEMSPYEMYLECKNELFSIENILNPLKIIKIDFQNNIIEFSIKANKNTTEQKFYYDFTTGLLTKIEEYSYGQLTGYKFYSNYMFYISQESLDLDEETKEKAKQGVEECYRINDNGDREEIYTTKNNEEVE